MFSLFLTCPRGLEEVCSQELLSIGIQNPIIKPGGLSFSGNFVTMAKVNLYSRTGMHLLVEQFAFKYENEKQFYSAIRQFKWFKFISPKNTFSILCHTHPKCAKINSQFLTLKAKDAIVDNIREQRQLRPSVSKTMPDYPITIAIDALYNVRVYLNSSGAPLNRRGYRTKIHKASLNEALAAGIILLSGWKKDQTLYDPMCGSGTLPIEAAMIARKIPPGIQRKFAFMKWQNFKENEWITILSQAKENIDRNCTLKIHGSDIHQTNIRLSRHNSIRASVNKDIDFSVKDFIGLNHILKPGILVCNPPYGLRLDKNLDIDNLYKNMGDELKQHYTNWEAYIFTANLKAAKRFGLKTASRIPLKNGTLDSRLLKFNMYKGSKDAT